MTRAFAFFLVTAGVLCGTRFGAAGPVTGNWAFKPKIGGQGTLTLQKDTPMSSGKLGNRVKFKGGRRACVIVMGDHDPIVPVTLQIHDDQGNLVAVDEPGKNVDSSKAPGNDVCAVVWYPPRDGYYKITIQNTGRDWNQCWVAIK